MAALDRTQLLDILKEVYPDGMSEEAVVKNHPGLAWLKRNRNPEFSGRYIHVPIQYGKTGGRSRAFSTAQSNVVASKYDAWDVTITSDYAVGTISGLAVDLAKGGKTGIFVDALMKEMDGSLATLGDEMARNMYRNYGAARGQRGSNSSSTTTLSEKSDIWFFEVGMKVCAASTDGTSGSLRDSGNALTITVVDEDAGTFTYTGSISGYADNDYLFQQGDFGVGAYGLQSWCPSSAPSSGENFFGMDRSTQPSRLAGVRFDAATLGYTIEEAFIQVKARQARGAAKTKYWFVHPKDLAGMETAMSSQRRIVNDNEYSIGFEAIDAYGVSLVADPNCQPGVAWGLAEDSFWLYSLGDCPRILDEDGLEILRSSTGDEYEFRGTARYQFCSPRPFGITRMVLPT